jgi:hypothetical protein
MRIVSAVFFAFIVVGCAPKIQGPIPKPDFIGKSHFSGQTFVTYIEDIEKSLAKEDANGAKVFRDFPKKYDHLIGPWFELNAHRLPPTYLFLHSGKLQNAKRLEEAIFWYIVARSRYLYDVGRCKDWTVRNRLGSVIGPQFKVTIEHAQKIPAKAQVIGYQALKWDREMPIHQMLPIDECKRGSDGMRQANMRKAVKIKRKPGEIAQRWELPMPEGGADQWLISPENFTEIRQKIFQQMEALVKNLYPPK